MKAAAVPSWLLSAVLGLHAAAVSALPEVESSLFSGSGNCAFCHEQWSGALLDASGNNVSITRDWRGTVMAHSFVDPLWRARMEAETAVLPSLREFIEDKCMTCHAPMARTQFRQDTGSLLAMHDAHEMELAADGVSCTLCHQIRSDNLDDEASLDGGYAIGTDRRIFGPYADVVTMPMRNHVDYTPGFGAHVQESAFCATCHTLFTPILDQEGNETGRFPEQVPYLEWQNSRYPSENRHCQDCHMPRLDEPIQITARPPWIGTREPFWRHTFQGANTFMLQLLADPGSGPVSPDDAEALELQLERTRCFLRRRTAVLSVVPEPGDGELLLTVKVQNLSGHKFPTGYPYRRAWLRVEVRDADGRTVFLSGDYDEAGRLHAGGTMAVMPHRQEITDPDQVQVYQAVMGDRDGAPTTYLLQAARYLKDNRIPPRGFDPAGPHAELTAVRGGAESDDDYAAGTGCDLTRYRIAVPDASAHYRIRAELLYQAVPPESLDPLRSSELPAAQAFFRLPAGAAGRPEVVQSVELTLNGAR